MILWSENDDNIVWEWRCMNEMMWRWCKMKWLDDMRTIMKVDDDIKWDIDGWFIMCVNMRWYEMRYGWVI